MPPKSARQTERAFEDGPAVETRSSFFVIALPRSFR